MDEVEAALEHRTEERQRIRHALIRTGQQDRDGFRELYELTSAKLYRICLRICGDRSAAEDVLHDVYVLVWKRADGFDPSRGDASGWLTTIARNRSIDWRRRQSSQGTRSIETAPDPADPEPLALDRMITDDTNVKVMGFLSKLDERQRGAIRSAFFDDINYAEMASIAGVPLSTIKSRIRRGLVKLRKALERDAGSSQ